MARKKRGKSEESQAAPAAVAVAEPQAPFEVPPQAAEARPTPLANDEVAADAPQKSWGDPYKRLFSSEAKGFEMGENRRYKQRVFKFKERPEQSVIDTLKEYGFTYRPDEKAWTVPASPETRRWSEELAQQLAGGTLGFER